MHRGFIIAGAVFGFLAVALGAFGAHALQNKVSNYALDIYKTGVTYQFFHALALCITGVLAAYLPGKAIRWAGRFFIIGIILFSFSLYTLAVIKGAVLPGYDWIGMITPFGGVSFLLGWLMLMLSARRYTGKV
jgi:uncharacterized membrane protein YgdD (TMEM256/DUF423 family)